MNCFVIMPFARDFDDVYATIKRTIESIFSSPEGRCFRLDETRPAGRITDRLLRELQAADLCVADLSGYKPNVMWEVGYAMALEKPIIIVTQRLAELPFDLKDMQSLEYDRSHLSTSLGEPLKRITIDTIQSQRGRIANDLERRGASSGDSELVAELLTQMQDLKSIVAQAVKAWSFGPRDDSLEEHNLSGLIALEGHWVDRESGSHFYGRVIRDDLIVPYCYADNTRLTGLFYNWRRMGDYWFTRFTWFVHGARGFSFLKNATIDMLEGAWWHDDGTRPISEMPLHASGYPARLERSRDDKCPEWASRFLADVAQNGLPSRLTSH